MKTQIMYIEYKGHDISGPGRIGLVTFSKTGKTLKYKGKSFVSLKGKGFKANYQDEETGEYYWVSGCKKNGEDRLYSGIIEIDDNIREEYWLKIRALPEMKNKTSFRCLGKKRG